MLDQDLNMNFFILCNFNTTLLVEKVLLKSGALSWIQRPFRAKSLSGYEQWLVNYSDKEVCK
jgi:hypothetical protein